MIRSFDWRDLGLLHRIRDRGLCLDSQLTFTRGPNVMQFALLDMLNPGRAAYTLVARPKGQAAIGQLTLPSGERSAHLTFLSPAEVLEEQGGAELLEALGRSGAEHGAYNLIAEVDEHSSAFEALRRAGFAIYSRQRLWRLEPHVLPQRGERGAEVRSADREDGKGEVWRPESASDEPAVTLLYTNLVPALVQQVEQAPRRNGRGLVHWRQGELLAYLSIDRGPLGVWVQPYVHPAAEDPDQLLAAFLAAHEDRLNRPLVVCVRSYQGWMAAALSKLGFEGVGDQAVMVKRLAVSLRQPQTAPLPALEGSLVKPTAPFVRLKHGEQPTPRSHGS